MASHFPPALYLVLSSAYLEASAERERERRACEVRARTLRSRKTVTPRFTGFFNDFDKKKNDCFAVYAERDKREVPEWDDGNECRARVGSDAFSTLPSPPSSPLSLIINSNIPQ